jgi:hypothetical protein
MVFRIIKKNSVDCSPQANYTDRATAACRQSLVPTFADRVCRMVSATDPQAVNFGFLDRSRYFLEIAPQLSSRGWVDRSFRLVTNKIINFLRSRSLPSHSNSQHLMEPECSHHVHKSVPLVPECYRQVELLSKTTCLCTHCAFFTFHFTTNYCHVVTVNFPCKPSRSIRVLRTTSVYCRGFVFLHVG